MRARPNSRLLWDLVLVRAKLAAEQIVAEEMGRAAAAREGFSIDALQARIIARLRTIDAIDVLTMNAPEPRA